MLAWEIGSESPAPTRLIRFDPPPPRAKSSALVAGLRGARSSERCSATVRMVASVQRSNTEPVRSDPLSAVAGRYGPADAQANGGIKRFSECARSQNGIALGCSKG